jgi:hypothetical protein
LKATPGRTADPPPGRHRPHLSPYRHPRRSHGHVEAVGIIPHAHLICKSVEGWAILPNAKRLELLKIDDWDFNWQDQYRYAPPLRLPADTRLGMEITNDNSEANPHNPNHPPKRVVWGPGVTDEMGGK